MSWLRKNPVFAVSLLVLGLTALGLAALIGERRAAARAAKKHFTQVSRELRTLETTEPSPTRENTALIEAEVARMSEILVGVQAELRPTREDTARVMSTLAPERRAEVYFDIAKFVEAMRARAREAGVLLRTDERFGFSRYAHEAPESGQLAAVFRERLVVQCLLEALLEAQPHQLLAVQRPRPAGKSGPGATRNPEGSPGRGGPGVTAGDYFEIDPRLALRAPGSTEVTAFRVSFTGHTKTLRVLLSRLADSELPLVVRAVEVTPAERPPERPAVGQPLTSPFVASAWSKFTVTVEFIALVSQPTSAS